METVWADSEHIMTVKSDYNFMDKGQRVTVTYADLEGMQEMMEAGMKIGRWPRNGGPGRVPPK